MKTKKFNQKVIIVTGASSGIGRASALAFAKEGAKVVLVARRLEKLQQVASRIIDEGGLKPLVITADVKSNSQVKAMVDQVIQAHQQIDILFNNAGASYVGEFMDSGYEEHLKEMIDLDLMGTIHVTQEVLKVMKRQAYGNILNMSSVVGRKAFAGFGAYSAVMHAISGFSDSLRQELKNTGIRISIIHPALTQTALLNHVNPDDMPAAFKAMTPISPEKVAEAALSGILRNKSRIIVPFQPKFLLLLDAISPRLGDWFVRVISRKSISNLLGMYQGKTYHEVALETKK